MNAPPLLLIEICILVSGVVSAVICVTLGVPAAMAGCIGLTIAILIWVAVAWVWHRVRSGRASRRQ